MKCGGCRTCPAGASLPGAGHSCRKSLVTNFASAHPVGPRHLPRITTLRHASTSSFSYAGGDMRTSTTLFHSPLHTCTERNSGVEEPKSGGVEELPHPEDRRGHSGSARRVREPCSAWCEDPSSPEGEMTTAQGNTGRRGRHHTCGPALTGSRNNNAPAATTRPTAIWTAGLTPCLCGRHSNGTLY
ncbi:hypothetical protein E2C01_015257 [Portunus trituberculatus]|uniref:Uncharacterized protein n=1 Tax=Portunus trituberculatus TaxID=210409 RepID=A0A5B7DM93_PORTR|nr:hypothetical protein [Portunus trituberculatus]